MIKYRFYNDYSEGCHPKILAELSHANLIQESGYGNDSHSIIAKKSIQDIISDISLDIHFLPGGTQTNLICLSSILKPYESVIAAETGHIVVHEAGAIESTGHKINTVKSEDGKLYPELIKTILDQHTDEHMVKPKVVFISNATEVGTFYTKSELEEISKFCKKHDLYLYMDGARLGSGLMAEGSNLVLDDIAKLTDMFYIGGTKNGALLGEAVIISNDILKKDFRYNIKQKGALLAKGSLLGIQFKVLFTENLYFDLANHANQMAKQLRLGLKDLGCHFLSCSTTNQIFPIFSNTVISEIEKMYGFYPWQKIDESNYAIRLVTSWATDKKMVYEFLKDVKAVLSKN